MLLLPGFCLALANLGDKEGTLPQGRLCLPLQNITLLKVLAQREQTGRRGGLWPKQCVYVYAHMGLTMQGRLGRGRCGGQGICFSAPTSWILQREVSFRYGPRITSVLLQLGSLSRKKVNHKHLQQPLHSHTSYFRMAGRRVPFACPSSGPLLASRAAFLWR